MNQTSSCETPYATIYSLAENLKSQHGEGIGRKKFLSSKLAKRNSEIAEEISNKIFKTRSKKAKIGGLKPVSLNMIMNEGVNELPEIVKGVLTCGATVLSGDPKSGKTILATQLAFSVSTGTEFLGYPCKKGDVLFISLEDNQTSLFKRIKKLPDAPQNDNIEFLFDFPLLSDGNGGGLKQLEDHLIDNPNISLVIIDMFNLVRPEKKPGVTINVFEHTIAKDLNQIGLSTETAIVVIHHNNKTSTQKDVPFNRVAGTNSFRGGFSNVWSLVRHSFENFGELLIQGREIDDQKLELLFNNQNNLVFWQKDTLGLSNECPLNREILSIFNENKETELSIDEVLLRLEEKGCVEEANSTERNRVTTYLRRLIKKGKLTSEKRGLYMLSPLSF